MMHNIKIFLKHTFMYGRSITPKKNSQKVACRQRLFQPKFQNSIIIHFYLRI